MDFSKRSAGAVVGLPEDPLVEILSRVPAKSIFRFRCVSKAWRDLIDDPVNRRRFHQTLEGFFSIFYPMCNLEHIFVKYPASSVPLDLDPCLSFLAKLPKIELSFVDSCNGLFLFEHCQKSNASEVLSYIVCNPATKHWATVPLCACSAPKKVHSESNTYLAFDPAVSSHFHLVHFWREVWLVALSVHTYSSQTGVWSHRQTDWNEQGQLEGWRRRGRLHNGHDQRTFVDGILHLRVTDREWDGYQIAAVDVQGRTKRTIKTPAAAQGRHWHSIPCIGQSQGRLHYINRKVRRHQSSNLSIWVLQDYDTQEWVLKDTVSFLRLFRRMTDGISDFDIIGIHPDRNVVFLQLLNRLITYDMDSKEVSVVATLIEDLVGEIVPYIPYLLESPALTNKN